MKKKRLTVKECKQLFPEVFQDAGGKPDKRIDENMERIMTHMINEGESPADAKLKTFNIAKHPDHFIQVPPAGAWPKLLYHEDGKTMKTVEDQEELDELGKQNDQAKRKIWTTAPTAKHLDRMQRGSVPRDENIKRLERELAAEIKAKESEKLEPIPA
jgi:hypothetical protein